MACNLTSAIALDCIDSIGGVKTLYISANTDLGTPVVGVTGYITSLVGATGTFYEYAVPKDTSSFNETFTVSNTNSSVFYQQDVVANLPKLSSEKRNQLLLLCKNRDLKVVVEDNNGLYWLVGQTRGAVVSAGTSSTGTAVGDLNGYTVTVQAQEPAMAIQLASLTALTGITIVSA